MIPSRHLLVVHGPHIVHLLHACAVGGGEPLGAALGDRLGWFYDLSELKHPYFSISPYLLHLEVSEKEVHRKTPHHVTSCQH